MLSRWFKLFLAALVTSPIIYYGGKWFGLSDTSINWLGFANGLFLFFMVPVGESSKETVAKLIKIETEFTRLRDGLEKKKLALDLYAAAAQIQSAQTDKTEIIRSFELKKNAIQKEQDGIDKQLARVRAVRDKFNQGTNSGK